MDGRKRYKSYHRFTKRKYYRYPGINKALLYYLRKGEESRRKTLQAVRRYGQGRVENWKQTKPTGMGLVKKRRRGKEAKRRYYAKKKKIFRKRKSKYLTWLYKNRPAVYYSFKKNQNTFQLYNYALPNNAQNSVLNDIEDDQIFDIDPIPPTSTDGLRCDYINYMCKLKMVFNVGKYGAAPGMYYHVPYIRVLVFRKWGASPNTGSQIKDNIYTMFKYPALMTSGYVKGFKTMWCKQFGVQLYIDKLLRVTSTSVAIQIVPIP